MTAAGRVLLSSWTTGTKATYNYTVVEDDNISPDFQWSQWLKSYTLLLAQKDIFGRCRHISCGLLNCSQTCIKNVLHVVVTLHHIALSIHAHHVTVWHCFSWWSNLTSLCFLQRGVIHSSQINVLYWLFVSQPDAGGLKHIHTHHCRSAMWHSYS